MSKIQQPLPLDQSGQKRKQLPAAGMGRWAGGQRIKISLVAGESPLERKRRLHRIANQKYKLKIYPNRRVGIHRAGPVTKEFILKNVTKDPITGCWNWMKGKANGGYGAIRENDSIVRAHRRAYELWVGSIPDGMLACHRCDNPPCCNPQHLFLGTDLDNRRDSIEKGRHPMGGNARGSKLKSEQVVEIRLRHMKVFDLSKKFNVTTGTIYRVINKCTYKNVP